MSEDRRFWDPKIETMALPDLQELQNSRLRQQIAWVYENSTFQRERMSRAGVSPDDITTVSDLRKIPLMDKDDYLAEQQLHPPFGRLMCIPENDVVRLWTTSGSTGQPRTFGSNLADYDDYLDSGARVLWTAGVRPGWRVAAPFSHGHWIGLWGVFDATWMKVGARILPLGGYGTEDRIRKLFDFGVDAICMTPTYAAYVSSVAARMNLDVSQLGVRSILIGGEPAAPATRRRIEETWGARTFDFYGNTENMSYLGVDCEEQAGFHVWSDRAFVEIVDADGNPVPDGEEGELAFTNLSSRSMPAIRLRIADVTRIDSAPCPCGRSHPRVQYILGRREDVVKVRGVNVYPRVAEDIVRNIDGLGSEYRIVIRHDGGLDSLVVQVEPLDAANTAGVDDEIRKRVKSICGITPEVELLPLGTLPVSELKAKRVFDERLIDEFSRVAAQ